MTATSYRAGQYRATQRLAAWFYLYGHGHDTDAPENNRLGLTNKAELNEQEALGVASLPWSATCWKSLTTRSSRRFRCYRFCTAAPSAAYTTGRASGVRRCPMSAPTCPTRNCCTSSPTNYATDKRSCRPYFRERSSLRCYRMATTNRSPFTRSPTATAEPPVCSPTSSPITTATKTWPCTIGKTEKGGTSTCRRLTR